MPRLITILILATALAAGCRTAPETLPTLGKSVAQYRARGEIDGESRRFRLMLYAEAPDAIHAEVVAPIGGTVLIVDGNDDEIAVSFVRDRLAFVGRSTSDAADYLLGFPLAPSELVTLLQSGRAPEGIGVEREGGATLYPERLVIETEGARLELERRRVRPLPAGSVLGDAQVPPGFERRPLEALRAIEAVPEMQAPQSGRG